MQMDYTQQLPQIFSAYTQTPSRGANEQEPKGRCAVRQVMTNLSLKEFEIKMETLFRRVVREEIERVLIPYQPSTSSSNQFELPQETPWQLHIEDKLLSTLFTGNRIESEVGQPVKIVIREAISKKTIELGPLSTLKVEILALDGDFGADDLDNWAEKDFSSNIVRAREGRRPLLAGNVIFRLTDGVGYVTDICFTDNSSWSRSGKFRLGVRSVQTIPSEARIREAISDAFAVKDQRGESYKKHYPPNLEDEVWRLKKIGKDGVIHGRLTDKGIATVKDLLQLYNVEPASLRGVVAVTFDGENPVALDMLDSSQMGMVEIMKRNAYENKNNSLLLKELSPLGSAMLQMSLLLKPSSSSSVQNVNVAGLQQAGDAAPFQSYDFTNK